MRILAALLLGITLAAQAPRLRFETSGGLESPDLAGTLSEVRALAASSPWLKASTFGTSPQGHPMPLLVLDRHREFDPAKARARGKAVLMIQASIHAGECEGKDAGLLLLRDLVARPGDLLEQVVVVLLPVFNVDGHERRSPYNRINQDGPAEMGWRTTATGLNLNRDYLKADAPEMRAWLKLHQAWLPDFFVDCHCTDGADYPYLLTYGEEVGPEGSWFLDPALSDWLRSRFLPAFRGGLAQAGIPAFPYVTFRRWHDPRSGLASGPATPRYSTGYQSAQNRPSVLLEMHMLKPYRQRVEGTRSALRIILETVAGARAELTRLNREADAQTASAAFRQAPLPLGFKSDGRFDTVAFQGYAYTEEKSDLTGGSWFRYDSSRPETWQLPFYRSMQVSASAQLPEAYLVPAEWTEVIERLQAHGIRFHRLKAAVTVPVAGYRFEQPVWSKHPVEGRFRVERVRSEAIQGPRLFPAGSALVPTSQRTARVIAHLLEPASDDSLLAWGFFNAIFEQKEYGESYVLEPLARRMLAADPALAEAYRARKAADPAFAASDWEQLNWFYQRSPWGDAQLNRYPVGRMLDAKVLAELLAR